MASYPVSVYRWDDPGAPQLPNGKPSEIIDILTKCLVDGYGDKFPLGWTRPFYDGVNQKAVFRNSVADGGSGQYAQFWSSDNTDGNNKIMKVTHAQSMTAIDDFFRKGYEHWFQASGGTSTTKMDKWILVGTSTGFYFIVFRNVDVTSANFQNRVCLFCGDYFSQIPNDAGRFITAATTQQNGDMTSIGYQHTLGSLNFASTDSNTARIYGADGGNDLDNYALFPYFNFVNNSEDTQYNDAPYFQPAVQPVFVRKTGQNPGSNGAKDSSGVLFQNSLISPTVRGVLPGLIVNFYSGYRQNSYPLIISLFDESHLAIQQAQDGGIRVFLNLENWNDPFNPV